MSSYEWASVIVAIVAAIIAAVSTVVAIASFIRAGKAVKAAEEANRIANDSYQASVDLAEQYFDFELRESGTFEIKNMSLQPVFDFQAVVFEGDVSIGSCQCEQLMQECIVEVVLGEAFASFKEKSMERKDAFPDDKFILKKKSYLRACGNEFIFQVLLCWKTTTGKIVTRKVKVTCHGFENDGVFYCGVTSWEVISNG